MVTGDDPCKGGAGPDENVSERERPHGRPAAGRSRRRIASGCSPTMRSRAIRSSSTRVQKVLLIDDELAELLAGARIDGQTTDQGLQLVIAKAREERRTRW